MEEPPGEHVAARGGQAEPLSHAEPFSHAPSCPEVAYRSQDRTAPELVARAGELGDDPAARLADAAARLKAAAHPPPDVELEALEEVSPARLLVRGARARLAELEADLRALLTDPGPAEAFASIAAVTTVSDLPLLASGKVREMYDLGEEILMVASDRVSTYDVVHPTPVPDKGKVLTGLSHFWFGRTGHICPNHLVSATEGVPEEVRGRALVVRRLDMLPVECVVRGYITGSGWKDYQATGAVCGIPLPEGLEESERLPEPIFTPATKAELGDHDENVDFERAVEIVGDRRLMEELRRLSLALYGFALEHALDRGIILADTKFEFGRDDVGRLVLGDEVLTPDSSRFWPSEGYEPGHSQPSFDKQIVRDWASGTGWDRRPPAPPLPDDVVERTHGRYLEAYALITGEPFDAWLEATGAS